MEKPQGTVVALLRDEIGHRAIVEVDALVACPRCAQGRGCGAGIFSGQRGNRRVEATIRPGLEIHEGDLVSIGLEPGNVLQAALIVYGLPLLGAATATAAAYLFAFGDLGAAFAAVTGLGAGGYMGYRRLDRQACMMQFIPTVSARIGPAGAPT
jgi:sigma-E factor negative regulatory protein RseC